MSTTSTAIFEHHADQSAGLVDSSGGSRASRKGFYQRLAENRERHATARIQSFLLGRSDAGLAALGFSPGEISAIRSTGVIPASFWPARNSR